MVVVIVRVSGEGLGQCQGTVMHGIILIFSDEWNE